MADPPGELGAVRYDTVPYPSLVHTGMHPDDLGTHGWLLGIDTAPPRACRTLELGCGDASTLLAMAASLPCSSFVGVDLSPAAVERGRSLAAEAGLENVELLVGDLADPALRDLLQEREPFDYVAAHGVLSWVPPPARTGLLAIVEAVLAERGVAYVSFNARPGGLERELTRRVASLLAPAAAPGEDPTTEVARVRAHLDLLVGLQDEQHPTWRAVLEAARDSLDERPAAQIHHDELSPFNEPFWLRDVVALAAVHGLRYLGEAGDLGDGSLHRAPALTAALDELGGDHDALARRDEHLDLVVGRRFHRTLLCRADLAPRLRWPVDPDRLRGLWVRTDAELAGPPGAAVDLSPGVPLVFGALRGGERIEVELDNTLLKTTLTALCSVGEQRYETLVGHVVRVLGAHLDPEEGTPDAAVHRALGAALPALHGVGLVGLSRSGRLHAGAVPERPRLSPLTAAQLRRGLTEVTSLRSTKVSVADEVSRAVLLACDGTADLDALAGTARPLLADRPGTDPVTAVDAGLAEAAAAGLFVLPVPA